MKKFITTTAIAMLFVSNVFVTQANSTDVHKNDLIKAIAKSAGITDQVAKNIFNITLSEIEANLKSGKKVQITDFGTFSISTKPQRTGIDPLTRKRIMIPAKKVVKFTPAKALTNTLNP